MPVFFWPVITPSPFWGVDTRRIFVNFSQSVAKLWNKWRTGSRMSKVELWRPGSSGPRNQYEAMNIRGGWTVSSFKSTVLISSIVLSHQCSGDHCVSRFLNPGMPWGTQFWDVPTRRTQSRWWRMPKDGRSLNYCHKGGPKSTTIQPTTQQEDVKGGAETKGGGGWRLRGLGRSKQPGTIVQHLHCQGVEKEKAKEKARIRRNGLHRRPRTKSYEVYWINPR